jgi:HlyD family type I secretion membrane fusion protein
MKNSPAQNVKGRAYALGSEVRSVGFCVAVLVLGLVGFSVLFPMDEAAMGQGLVVAQGGNTPIQTAYGGNVQSVHVKEGEFVRRGQLLVLLDPKVPALAQARLGEPVVRLLALRQRLKAQVQGEAVLARPPEYDALASGPLLEAADRALSDQVAELGRLSAGLANELAEIRSGRIRLQRQLASANEQLGHSQAQLRLLRQELEGLQQLQKEGYVANNRVRAAESAVEAQMAVGAQLRASIDDLTGLMVEADLRHQRVQSDFIRSASERLVEVELQLGGQLSQLGLATVELQEARIQAPQDGWVLGLSVVGAGQALAAGDRVLSLVPAEAERVVTAAFDARRGAQIHADMPADIRVAPAGAGFTHIIHGRVFAVGADAQVSETIAPTISATITIPQESQNAGRTSALRPGTPVQVAVITRRRTLLEYIFEPVFGATWSAFREP